MNLDDVKWPEHKAGLRITNNEHKNFYENIEDYISTNGLEDKFISPEDMLICINKDTMWIIQWYPDTPVGSCGVCASTLQLALDHINKEP